MRKSQYFLLISILFLFNFSDQFSQIKIKELPSSDFLASDSSYFNISDTREVMVLSRNWKIYEEEEPEKSADVTVPSSFEGADELIYERDIYLSPEQIETRHLSLRFLGVNYTAEIMFNGLLIYKHSGGLHPFSVSLPSDILKPGSQNKLTVKIFHSLDEINTIPLVQGFLFPVNQGGLIREVLLELKPKIHIEKIKIDYTLSENFASAEVNTVVSLKNTLNSRQKKETQTGPYHIDCSVNRNGIEIGLFNFEISPENDFESFEQDLTFNLSEVKLWSPTDPEYYTLIFSLSQNDTLLDKSIKVVNFFQLRNGTGGLSLNGDELRLKGTTYIKSTKEFGRLIPGKELIEDLALIKETGFNMVRFAKQVPHPYVYKICRELGLLVFVELPLSSIPEEIIRDPDFMARAESQINSYIDELDNCAVVAAIGLGSGFAPNSPTHKSFITNLAVKVKARTNILTYVSMLNLPGEPINGVDLLGVELYSENSLELTDLQAKMDNLGNTGIFISEATYPSFKGSTNGYLNVNSNEAQAKFFRDVIKFTNANDISGFCLNTFYDYKGKFGSFYAGYQEDYIYQLGILENRSDKNAISYKTVKGELFGSDKITIPIGAAKDESPIMFIIIGLAISIFMALLINSNRKFREDAGRALMRPYNFFADIRDLRILSGFQTNILMLVLSGSLALVAINLLYFLKTNILIEKILLSFVSQNLIDVILFVAWHPVEGFLILWGISIIIFVLLSLAVKFFTFFIKNKVFFSSIYYTVIWSLLPLSLLLPLELVLYRILIADVINIYIYGFIILFVIWLLQRLLKGIYVIFEVRPAVVYFYSFIFLVVIFGGLLLYFQLQHSTLYFILQAFRDYQLI